MKLAELLDSIAANPKAREHVTAWLEMPAWAAHVVPFPSDLQEPWRSVLERHDVHGLYLHQAEARSAVAAGRDVVVVTPTASGKTLCYNLPVAERLLREPEARALYLYPTKALAHDQLAGLVAFLPADLGIQASTYDGDTPPSERAKARETGRIFLTNPDMLHAAILPHHERWAQLFRNLTFIVLDELHTYRGVFGSHVANVLRRTLRVAASYGAEPRFIATSATIANPGDFASRLFDRAVEVVERDGAPRGKRHFIVSNPPLVDPARGLRRGARAEARSWMELFLRHRIPAITFVRSRAAVELLLREVRAGSGPGRFQAEELQGYRGGYLPGERRSIEQGLREGRVLSVVTTNALELGIDAGSLEACVLCGYPGTVASTWQQAGRAGRRSKESVVVLVTSQSPLDQYLTRHPESFFRRVPEAVRIHPDNRFILASHAKCAAFELPFQKGETFAGHDVIPLLDGNHVPFPAGRVSLRSAAPDQVVIVDVVDGSVIGEVDRLSAPLRVHDEAIYFHAGTSYRVERLDLTAKRAFVRRVEADYYTDAHRVVEVRILRKFASRRFPFGRAAHGEVALDTRATIFKKMRADTHENAGWGRIHLPEDTMVTAALWLTFTVLDPSDETTEGILAGLARLTRSVAPLYLLCDTRDIGVIPQLKATDTGHPTLYLYDAIPGGVGLAEHLYEQVPSLLEVARDMLRHCPCEAGCPSCIGPESGAGVKQGCLSFLEAAARTLQGVHPPRGS